MIRMTISALQTLAPAWKESSSSTHRWHHTKLCQPIYFQIQTTALPWLKEKDKAGTSWWSRSKWKDTGRRNLQLALPPNNVPRLGPLVLLLSEVQSEQKEQIEEGLWKLACFSYYISCLKKSYYLPLKPCVANNMFHLPSFLFSLFLNASIIQG